MRIRQFLAAPALAAAALLACNDPTGPKSPEVVAVQLTESELTIPFDGTARLGVASLDANGQVVSGGPAASWSSTDPLVAEVDPSGLVIARDAGTTRIIVQVGALADTALVHVGPAPPAAISVTPATADIAYGSTTTLTALVTDVRQRVMTGYPVTWTTVDAAKATVASDGTVTALDSGEVRIVGAAGDARDTALVRIAAPGASSVEISMSRTTIPYGETAQGTATVRDSRGRPVQGQAVVWQSLDPTKASVDANGLVTALDSSSARIVATAGTVADTVTVTLGAPPVGSIAISPGSASLLPGDSVQLTATVRDAKGRILTGGVTWASSRDEAATITADGLVRAVGPGETTITASRGGKAAVITVTVAAIRLATLDAGTASNCGLLTDGRGYCWPDRIVPPGIVPGGPVAAVEVGQDVACTLDSEGRARCWGENTYGTVGDGTDADRTTPTLVSGGITFSEIEPTEGAFTCGLDTAGSAWCWGNNWHAQLGIGVTGSLDRSHEYKLTPQRVVGGHTFTTISGGREHACALAPDGTAYCWGSGTRLQTGPGSATYNTPRVVDAVLKFSAIDAGARHSCAITAAGQAFCWGDADNGRLGQSAVVPLEGCKDGLDYDYECIGTPAPVQGGHTFTAITAGEFHTCAIDTAGDAWCWGANDRGQLGIGSFASITTGRSSAPTRVVGGLKFTAIAAGSVHTCGIATDGYTYCWGDGRETGVPGGATVSEPTRIQGQ